MDFMVSIEGVLRVGKEDTKPSDHRQRIAELLARYAHDTTGFRLRDELILYVCNAVEAEKQRCIKIAERQINVEPRLFADENGLHNFTASYIMGQIETGFEW